MGSQAKTNVINPQSVTQVLWAAWCCCGIQPYVFLQERLDDWKLAKRAFWGLGFVLQDKESAKQHQNKRRCIQMQCWAGGNTIKPCGLINPMVWRDPHQAEIKTGSQIWGKARDEEFTQPYIPEPSHRYLWALRCAQCIERTWSRLCSPQVLQWHAVLVCWGCRNQVPQTEWFMHRNSLSHSFRSWKFEIRMSAGLISPEASLLLPSPCGLTWSFLCRNLCHNFLLCKDTSHIR